MVNRKFGLTDYTIGSFLDQVVARYGSRPAVARVGQEPITYAEFAHRIDRARTRLQHFGIVQGDKVALIGRSSPEWVTAWLAVITMGAIAVPVLEDFSDEDVDHVLDHSESRCVLMDRAFFEDRMLPGNAKRLVLELTDLSVLNAPPDPNALEQIARLPARIARTIERTLAPPRQLVTAGVKETDVAEIIYTSGTTGHSRGVQLTHFNLVSNLFEGPDILGVIRPDSVILSILPLAHTFGSTSGFLSIIYCGSVIYFLGKKPAPRILVEAMQQVRPTILGAVPLVFEKIYNKQVLPAIRKSAVLRAAVRTRGGRKLVHRLIGRKISKVLGGRLECAIIGGAGINPDVEVFLREAGIPYTLGYGLTECSPLVTFAAVGEVPIGSVGYAIPGVDLKIVEKDPVTGVGEILVKGPSVMAGYYKNEAETTRTFTQDGWFITGDRGILDENGNLFIRGRSKNVIIGPSGENIHPEAIEAILDAQPGVEESIVFREGNRLLARVVPDYEYLRTLIPEPSSSDIERFLETIRHQTNRRLSANARLAGFIEQPEPFVKTATNKIKRYLYVAREGL